MNLDIATFQLLILATPGIIWALFEDSLSRDKTKPQFLFFVRSLVYGLIAFSILWLIYNARGIKFDVLNFNRSSTFSSKIDEIAWSVPIALVLAIMSIANSNHGWTTRILRALKITDFTGTDDIWEYALGKSGQSGEYVYIRNFVDKLVYFGLVKAYSDRPDIREILLEDVSVYDLKSDLLFELDRIYITLECKSARIEFPCSLKENANARRSRKAKPIAAASPSRERPRETRKNDVREKSAQASSSPANGEGLKVKGQNMARNEKTGKKAGSSASKVLKDKRTGKDSKTAAGSALTQRPDKKKT